MQDDVGTAVPAQFGPTVRAKIGGLQCKGTEYFYSL